MDRNMKRDIILDNYQNPYHRLRHDDEMEYMKVNSRNVSCIDNIDLYIKVKDDRIEDISFDGEACVISTSSTNIMSNLLRNKSVDDAIKIIENYKCMIDEKSYDKNILGEAIVYDDIYKQPARKPCVTIFARGIEKVLNIKKNNV